MSPLSHATVNEWVVWGDGLRLRTSIYDTLRPAGEDIRFHDLEISNHWHVLLNNPENTTEPAISHDGICSGSDFKPD
jgi:hypothetical protein